MKAYIIPIEDYEKAVNRGKEVARFEARITGRFTLQK
jgi:hypothetical protein